MYFMYTITTGVGLYCLLCGVGQTDQEYRPTL